MFTIKIRFNTDHKGSPLVWRAIINGEEHLASDIRIFQRCDTTCDEIAPGVVKHHITVKTYNKPVWNGSVLLLT